jgi:hypothetical protein
MNRALQIIVALPGLLFVGMGLRWIIDPTGAAAFSGMPLLDGVGLSSQIGDLGAFFLCLGLFIFLGLITRKRCWFVAPLMLVGITAVFRVLAWLLHDAALAVDMIVPELIIAGILAYAASRLPNQP